MFLCMSESVHTSVVNVKKASIQIILYCTSMMNYSIITVPITTLPLRHFKNDCQLSNVVISGLKMDHFISLSQIVWLVYGGI